ncbi:UNVERIFIED_CONTAM: hypothetical protein GTU68_035863 [Idotea baltica]|nr:hypothetical protein [Idotea baltica]
MLDLTDPTLLTGKAYVGGEWQAGATHFPVTNPATGEEIAQVADCDAADATHAIAVAADAQKQWAKCTALERADVLMALYNAMIDNRDDLAKILTAEMGKPLAEAAGEITYGAGFIRWFAEEARRSYGDVIPGHQGDKRLFALKQPVGVVAAITPWNFPNAMITRKLGPALAAGCAMVLKPASETPFSALALAVLAERSGLPAGLFSVLPTKSSAAVGGVFCDSEIVRKLTFTGSTQTGRLLMSQCASTIKKGATVLTGGALHCEGGTFFQPTVLSDVTRDMLVASEETFGPVSPLFRFSDTEEVIAAANDTPFGLASYFYAKDLSRVWKVAEALEYGMVGVNTGLISTEVAPFGGVKQSGLGREGARQGMEDFQEVKYLCVAI